MRRSAEQWISPLEPSDRPWQVERIQGGLEESRWNWYPWDARAVDLGVLPNLRAGAVVNEDDAVEALLTAHADMARLTVELADARERRRAAARQLVELGRGTSWIAARLGVTPQAVDGFLKYKERAGGPRSDC